MQRISRNEIIKKIQIWSTKVTVCYSISSIVALIIMKYPGKM